MSFQIEEIFFGAEYREYRARTFPSHISSMHEESTVMLSSLCEILLPKPAIYPDSTPWTVIIRNELGISSFLAIDLIMYLVPVSGISKILVIRRLES